MSSRSGSIRSRLASRGSDVVGVVLHDLRLLLGLLLLLFLTADTWRYVGQLPPWRLTTMVVITVAAAVMVVGLGIRRTCNRSLLRTAVTRVALEVVTFGVAMFLLFVVVGAVSVSAGLTAEWAGTSDLLLSWGGDSDALVITGELLQVAAFLATLGALALAVEVITDKDARQALLRDLLNDPT